MTESDYANTWAWSIDFVRAINNRPWIYRQLFRIAVGRYAYREFIGLATDFQKRGYLPDLEYALQDCDYHNDPIPRDYIRVVRGDYDTLPVPPIPERP